MSVRIFGSAIRRREDPRLLTGLGTFTDDLSLPGMVHAAMLRSPHAHARIVSIDTAKAATAPGVLAVYLGKDIAEALKPMPCAWLLPNADLKIAEYPIVARDTVRYVGDIVAVVVAATAYQAYDALDLIEVKYQTLPAVVDPQKSARGSGAPIHESAPGNQAFHWKVAGGDADAAFAVPGAVVVKDRIIQQRLIPTPMETRSALAQWTAATGELTLWNTTQNPHIVRFIGSLVMGVPEDKLRVVAPEVGGGFGAKIAQYPADFITCFCSMKLHRPVKWTETRSENYVATTHGRDHVQEVELCGTHGGQDHGGAGHRVGRHGRVSLDRRAWNSDHPPRPDAVRALHDRQRQGRRLRPLHQHHAGGGVSRRRPPRGHLPARTADRSLRACDRQGPGRGAPHQPDPEVRQRPQRGHRADLRQRQLPRRRSTS